MDEDRDSRSSWYALSLLGGSVIAWLSAAATYSQFHGPPSSTRGAILFYFVLPILCLVVAPIAFAIGIGKVRGQPSERASVDENPRFRAAFRAWSLIACPVIAWAVGIWSSHHRGSPFHSVDGGIVLFALLPAALVAVVGRVSNRAPKEILWAAIGSAAIAYGGVIAFAIYFFMTVPDGFFN